MRLPVDADAKQDSNVRKRRRRAGPLSNDNNNNGGNPHLTKNGDGVVTETQRKDKVANFAHHKRVADYLLGKSVGEGSFAKVRLGLHVQTAEEVAVKVMSKARAKKDSYVNKNLRREGRILQMARHKHIVQVYDILETDNNYYLVTEYCSGGELIDIVSDKGCLPEHDVRRYMAQLVSAVAHLHSHGIVHRDLKVENLLLNDRGEVKIIDFGLSNVISATHSDPTRALTTQCGSPAYAAPELLAKHTYGPKVDVWSIGVITYALLVGKLPFTVEPFRIPKLCRKMLLGDMNPIPSHLSGNCRHFIRRLLVPDPDVRPTIEQVIKMAWISQSSTPAAKLSFSRGLANGAFPSPADIDTEVIREMTSKLNYEFSDVLNCVRKNRPGEVLATYYLLLKQRTHSNEVNGRLANKAIGSDGNLDVGQDSESKSSDDEEGSNDVDDVTNGDILDNLFKADELYQATPPAIAAHAEDDKTVKVPDAPSTNHDIVDEVVEKFVCPAVKTPSDGSEAEKTKSKRIRHSKTNGHDTPRIRERIVIEHRELTKGDIERNSGRQAAQNSPRDSDNNSDIPSISDAATTKSSERPERKSRGQSSMRDLFRTMSRAREVLRMGSKSTSKKTTAEDSKAKSKPESNRFDTREAKIGDGRDEPKTLVVDTKYNHRSPMLSRNLWRGKSVHTEGPYSPSSPKTIRNTLPTPLIRTHSSTQGHSPPSEERLLYRRTSQRSPQRSPSLRTRKSRDSQEDDISTEQPGLRLPRIWLDRPSLRPSMIPNPLGYGNLTPRGYVSTPPRTPVSRENAMGNSNSGVKEIIEKFQSLMSNDSLAAKRSASRAGKVDANHSQHDPTAAAMAYLASNRVKREQQLKLQTPSPPRQMPLAPDCVSKHLNDPFLTHFRQKSDISYLNEDTLQPYKISRQYSPQSERSPIGRKKTTSPALWYKSAV